MKQRMYSILKRSSPPSHKFVEWCRQIPTVIPGPIKLDEYFRENRSEPDQDKILNSFLEKIHASIQDGIASVDLNRTMTRQEIKICGEDASWDRGLHRLQITQGVSGSFTIENLSIRECFINNKSGYPIIIYLNSCNIFKLTVNTDYNCDGEIEVHCKDTNIGHLEMREAVLNSLIMDGGCILNITCPPPGAKSPIIGDVSFANVFFPRNTKDFLLSGAQAYRSFRHHLMTLQNIQAANLIRSAELSVERETDLGMNKLLGRLYEVFSDHGSSTWRPIAWLLSFFFISFFGIFFVSGAVQGIPDEAMYTGWRSMLIEPGCNVWQALYLAFQPIINPLGIFSSKTFLVPKSGWIAALLMLQGLLSPVLIALFIFAVRRRFRLNG